MEGAIFHNLVNRHDLYALFRNGPCALGRLLVQHEPLLQEYFEVLEMKPYGGIMLHLLFNGIAHHFCSQDAEAKRWLDILFDVEDVLLGKGELSSDFLVAVCRKRQTR
jgi:hypothetical protein